MTTEDQLTEQPASAAASAAGRALAAQRRRELIVCAVCTAQVYRLPRAGGASETLYCSQRCAMRAYRARRIARQRAQEQPPATPAPPDP